MSSLGDYLGNGFTWKDGSHLMRKGLRKEMNDACPCKTDP